MRSFLPFWFALAAPVLSFAQTNIYIQTNYQTADDLYIAGRYEEALAAYQDLYQQSADPEFLFKMARSAEQLGRKQTAIESYRAFLLSSSDAVLRADAERYLAALDCPTRPAADPDALVPLSLDLKATSSKPPLLNKDTRSGKLFRISAVTGLASVAAGMATMSAARSTTDIAPGQEDVDMTKFAALASLTDVLFVTSASTGIAGAVIRKRELRQEPPALTPPPTLTASASYSSTLKKSQKLFRISGASAAAGLTLGGLSMLKASSLQSSTFNDPTFPTETSYQQLRMTAAASDMFNMVAIGTATAGLVVRKRERQSTQEPQLTAPSLSLRQQAPTTTHTQKLKRNALVAGSAALGLGIVSMSQAASYTSVDPFDPSATNETRSLIMGTAIAGDLLLLTSACYGVAYFKAKRNEQHLALNVSPVIAANSVGVRVSW